MSGPLEGSKGEDDLKHALNDQMRLLSWHDVTVNVPSSEESLKSLKLTVKPVIFWYHKQKKVNII